MAKVLPSDVAERIGRAFPWVKSQSHESVPHPANQQQALNWVAGVLALIEQIPDSLLRFDSNDYGDFLWAQAGLRPNVGRFTYPRYPVEGGSTGTGSSQ